METQNSYAFLDSGSFEKLEQFGPYLLIRPSSIAVWEKALPSNAWEAAHGLFSRQGKMGWKKKISLPKRWVISCGHLQFLIEPTPFGHLGVFPEQQEAWQWVIQKIHTAQRKVSILNLFAYSGGATFAAAKAGAAVTHVDASKGMVSWAQENAKLNHLEKAPIRWIVDDVKKYLSRCLKRGERFDGIILDPPSFGRGPKNQVFKLENDLVPLLSSCAALLSSHPLFVLLSCHTPGFTPLVIEQALASTLSKHGLFGNVASGEMLLRGKQSFLPSGNYARWER